MKPQRLRRMVNFWPLFLFAGIKVERIADDWRYAKVRLKLRWYNRNYVGTQFGGSLFSMTDPWWMILVMECLGRDYVVWDHAGEIVFVAPGRQDVFAEFRVEDAVLDELRAATANGEKGVALVRHRDQDRERRAGRSSTQTALRAAQARARKQSGLAQYATRVHRGQRQRHQFLLRPPRIQHHAR